ncbi:Probable serine/threonine-protein kinase dyrk2 [Linum perenne]
MEDTKSVDVILDFLRRNRFTRAEAALRSELGVQPPDLNGFLQKLSVDDKEAREVVEERNGSNKPAPKFQGSGSRDSCEDSKELIVKEIDCNTHGNRSEGRWKTSASAEDRNVKPSETVGGTDPGDTVLDLYSWKSFSNNGPSPYQNDRASTSNFSGRSEVKSRDEVTFSSVKKSAWQESNSGFSIPDSKNSKIQTSDPIEFGQQVKTTVSYPADNPWSVTEQPTSSSTDIWNDCSVKTVLPFNNLDGSTSYDMTSDKKEGKKKADVPDVRAAIKEKVDEVGRAFYFGKSQGSIEPNNLSTSGFPIASDNPKEDYPRLPPVRLKSEDKLLNVNWQEKFERDKQGAKISSADSSFLIGSYLDVPIGQEINSSVDDSAGKRIVGGSWLSVSQGIAEDDLVSGFATVGDGLSESIDYPNQYWDSDEYDDDEDVGYTRQPIEDEAWFLAHEIDYPSDNEKGTVNGSVPDPQESGPTKDEDDDQSFAEEDSYFSGERYFQTKNVEPVTASDDPIGLSVTEIYGRTHDNDLMAQYDGQLLDEEELNLMCGEPVWQGFVTQTNELVMLGDGKVTNNSGRTRLDDVCMDDDQHGSVRSIGVGINSDVADFGSEIRDSLIGGSSEGDLEYFRDNDAEIRGYRASHQDSDKKYGDKHSKDKKRVIKQDFSNFGNEKVASTQMKALKDGGFSFPPPLRDSQEVQAGSSKSLWSNKSSAVLANETSDMDHLDALTLPDDMLGGLKLKSSGSSTAKSYREGNNAHAIDSADSTPSTLSNYAYTEKERAKKEEDEKIDGVVEEPGMSLEDEEAIAVQEQVRQIKAQEEEFETFNLKIVHRKNRTGFEEDKNFHVVLNSVLAGRYHVTEYLGSAAFSKAIQAHDLHTGMDVCVKIIKNNKDFFDQSLDEIKLLKYVNRHDPADKYHLLRLYDYFYYREHLLIVCELLKANLYEFHKFNRESGGEVYFTMPRLQSITIQCLEALQFLHSLGLIHCDLKPENILVKSYSRCEVKVIDLGSSCFETDHLCSYVQSRSYRAPEVILGLPYDKKIDVWSLGCILAELCTGNVLFQNDSPATLLARVIGIIGAIEQEMLAKGRDTYKYFTKNHMLYERNQETNRLEYLVPKKTSLRHRLPMGDHGFIDFVRHLLEVNPNKRPSAAEALKHPWLSFPYEPISA